MSSGAAVGRPIKIRPGAARYAWGDGDLLAQLLGSGLSHAAEAWLGAHPARPALAELDAGAVPLDRLVARRPESLLGPWAARRYGGLPYLMKVLAARRPLSIQVHPDARQAAAGFAREEAARIRNDAPDRIYRDPNPKPELLVALTPFHALCGFRPKPEIDAALDRVPEIRDLLPPADRRSGRVEDIVRAYFAVPDAQIRGAHARLIARLRREIHAAAADLADPADPARWLIAAADAGAIGAADRGVLLVFLLDIVALSPGEGMFVPPGVPHAYLRGAGVEIMASSDNVVRCGLTSKHVDPAEMFRIVDFGAAPSRVLAPVDLRTQAERVFRTPAEEFELGWVDAPRFEARAHGVDTLLHLGGDGARDVTVSSVGGSVVLRRGEGCLVPNGVRYTVHTPAPARLFRATVPRRGAVRDAA